MIVSTPHGDGTLLSTHSTVTGEVALVQFRYSVLPIDVRAINAMGRAM